MAKWKKIGDRSYEYNSPTAQAFVFSASRPECLWAWSVYWRNGHQAWVENRFRYAIKKAEQCIAAAEGVSNGKR